MNPPRLAHTENPDADRRLETRFLVADPVKISLLSDSGAETWGQTVNVSTNGLSLTTPTPIPPGSPVKLEVPDGLILCEVRFCQLRQESPKEYLVGLSIEHVLFGWMEFYERAVALDIVVNDSEIVAAR